MLEAAGSSELREEFRRLREGSMEGLIRDGRVDVAGFLDFLDQSAALFPSPGPRPVTTFKRVLL